MKTRWSYEYLERKLGSPDAVRRWAAEKRAVFVAETGVRWSVSMTANGVKFRPYPDRETEPLDDPALVEAFKTTAREKRVVAAIGIDEVGEAMGVDPLTACRVAQHLARTRQANLHVDRGGMPVFIRLRVEAR